MKIRHNKLRKQLQENWIEYWYHYIACGSDFMHMIYAMLNNED